MVNQEQPHVGDQQHHHHPLLVGLPRQRLHQCIAWYYILHLTLDSVKVQNCITPTCAHCLAPRASTMSVVMTEPRWKRMVAGEAWSRLVTSSMAGSAYTAALPSNLQQAQCLCYCQDTIKHSPLEVCEVWRGVQGPGGGVLSVPGGQVHTGSHC